jgi:hypothetical protein
MATAKLLKNPLAIFIVVVMLLGAIAATVIILAPKPAISKTIQRQVTTTIFVTRSARVVIDKPSVAYNDKLKLLTYAATTDGVKVVVSQQPSPTSFIDIPQVFDKVLAEMREYSKFEVAAGTVHLTRPKDLKGKQAAVLNSKGTLMFVKPESDLSDDQWRQLFAAFVVLS